MFYVNFCNLESHTWVGLPSISFDTSEKLIDLLTMGSKRKPDAQVPAEESDLLSIRPL